MSRPRPFHLVAFAAILAINACGGDGGTEPPPPPPPPANQAPQAVGSLGTLTFSVGGTVTIDVAPNFRDPDGDALTFSATSSDAGIVGVAVSGGSIDVAGNAPGTATVTVTARDPGGLTATQQLGVTVDGPPVLTDSIPNQVMDEGASTTLDLADHFTDDSSSDPTYEAATSDATVATVSIDGSTATITGVGAGSATLTFTARDEYGQTATQEVGVTVEEANQAPRATDSIPAQELMPDGEATLDLSGHFTDPDDDALTYEGATSDADVATVSIDGSNATITGVAAGTATITFTASDPEGLSAGQEAMVTVNTPPMPEGTIDTVTVTEGESTTMVVSGYFSDADGDELTYEASSSDDEVATASVADSTMTINGVGGGTATVTVTATDPRGAAAEQVAVVRVNRAPVPSDTDTLPGHDMVRGNAVILDMASFFTDPDGDALTFTATTSNADLATTFVEGSVVTTRSAASDSTAPAQDTVILTVTATDPWGLSVEQEALVRVNAMEYDTLAIPIVVNKDGTLTATALGQTIELTACLTITNLPFDGVATTVQWTEWQRQVGTGWVTEQFTPGQLCPIKLQEDRYPLGVYRMIGRISQGDETGTYRSPTVEKEDESQAKSRWTTRR